MQPANMELNQLVKYVEQIKVRRGFDGTSIEQEMVRLMEEVGELAREVWEVVKVGHVSDEGRRDLAFEIVDCLIFLLSIAGMTGITDIEGYFLEKEAINIRRFE